jgi:uncharacterized protein (TIGR04255 family)
VGRQRHLGQAPIHEALIDIQFDQVLDVDVGEIAKEFSEAQQPASVSDLYLTMFEVKVEKDTSPQATSVANAIGKRIDIPSKHQVVQFRNNGFTFSRLAPYESWDEMAEAAMQAWNFFSNRVGSGQINRIAVRYINVLEFPLPIDTFDTYLTSPPRIPNELQSGISAFLTRVVCPQGEDMMIVTQSLEGDSSKAIKVILDIDVSHQCKLDRQDFSAVDAVLKRLRVCKNNAFFAYLTDDALEIYA